MDEGLLDLTHTCRGWREVFISRSSLWTKLNFANLDETRTLIQRSKSSPLKFHLEDTKASPFNDHLFSLAIPHLHKLKSLTIFAGIESEVFNYFHYHASLLEELNIHVPGPQKLSFGNELFSGDLSSLRKLSLVGITTSLPWKNLANLQVFVLGLSTLGYDITQLLDFLSQPPSSILSTLITKLRAYPVLPPSEQCL